MLIQENIINIQNMISLTNSTIQNLFFLNNNQNIHREQNTISKIKKKNPKQFLMKKRQKFQSYSPFDYSNNRFEVKKQTLHKNENENEIKNIQQKNNIQYIKIGTLNENNIKNIEFSSNNKFLNKIKKDSKISSIKDKETGTINVKDIKNQNDEIDINKSSSIPINSNLENNRQKEIFLVTHENDSNLKNKNNQFKVFKNRKIVYVNSSILNSYTSSRNLKKVNEIAFITRTQRSSKYRGVSKNGNQWQVLFMNHKNKTYIGSYKSEEVAARIYDILSIKKKGISARTNFTYNMFQINKIQEMFIDIKSKNINEFINNLFK